MELEKVFKHVTPLGYLLSPHHIDLICEHLLQGRG